MGLKWCHAGPCTGMRCQVGPRSLAVPRQRGVDLDRGLMPVPAEEYGVVEPGPHAGPCTGVRSLGLMPGPAQFGGT